jgi:hypothetical protein
MSTASSTVEAATDPAEEVPAVAGPGVPGTDRLVEALSRVRFQLGQTQVALDTFMNRVIEQAGEPDRPAHPEPPAALAGHLVAPPEIASSAPAGAPTARR